MLRYIIRLDDACPKMNEKNWIRVEEILNKYDVKPIVGIIPNNKDEDFAKYNEIENFWDKYAKRWQENGWIIAQHGLNHNLSKTIRTEFTGKSYDKQKQIIEEGYKILRSNGIVAKCFFAPNHTFDDNTIKVCRELKYFEFISDGYAYFPYVKNGMLFIPSVFDTPHVISKNGIFTFVYHPNNMKDASFEYLEKFIKLHQDNFNVDIDEVVNLFKQRKRNFKDRLLEIFIKVYRSLRNIVKQ